MIVIRKLRQEIGVIKCYFQRENYIYIYLNFKWQSKFSSTLFVRFIGDKRFNDNAFWMKL